MPRDKTGHFYYSWFPTIFTADTQHLSLAEDGAYRRLLDHYMTTRSPLPANDAALARIVGIGLSDWEAVKETVRSFFKPSDNPVGFLIHSFCQEALSVHDARINRSKENGKKGGRPKLLKNKVNNPAGFQIETQQKPDNKTEQNKTGSLEGKPSPPVFPPLPEYVSDTLWDEFRQVRKRLKKPMTPKAEELILRELEKLRLDGHDPTERLEYSIANSYPGVYKPRGADNGNRSTTRQPTSSRCPRRFAEQDYNAGTDGFVLVDNDT